MSAELISRNLHISFINTTSKRRLLCDWKLTLVGQRRHSLLTGWSPIRKQKSPNMSTMSGWVKRWSNVEIQADCQPPVPPQQWVHCVDFGSWFPVGIQCKSNEIKQTRKCALRSYVRTFYIRMRPVETAVKFRWLYTPPYSWVRQRASVCMCEWDKIMKYKEEQEWQLVSQSIS